MKCYVSDLNMSKKKHNLIVVSHPDDETLFFAGLMLAQCEHPWIVACVTDGNADGLGAKRLKQFQKAAKLLGAEKIVLFNLPDKFASRLQQKILNHKLSELETPNEVYTHGPIGEYGHPHHQDVSYAVHNFYYKKCSVYSVAHNCMPDKIINLTAAQLKIKNKIISEIYFNETKRFINFVPSTSTESFVKIKLNEVQTIYNYLAVNKMYEHQYLDKYKWYEPYFKEMKKKSKNRPF